MKNIFLKFLLLFLCIFLVGCGGSKPEPEDPGTNPENPEQSEPENPGETGDPERPKETLEKIYATIYEPARCLYETDEAHEKAVEKYKNEYLKTVGSLDNTFEERFRGNVYPQSSWKSNKDEGVYEIYFPGTIDVYSEEARDYLLNVVFPEYADEYDVPSFDEEKIESELNQPYHRTENPYGYQVDNFNNAYWRFRIEEDLAKELFTLGSESYKRWFNHEDSPLTNNPFIIGTLYENYLKPVFTVIVADGRDVQYAYYKLDSKMSSFSELYKLLCGTETTTGPNGNPIVYENIYGEYEEFVSSGYVAKDEEGNFIYDEEGNVTKKLYDSEIVKEAFGLSDVAPARS